MYGMNREDAINVLYEIGRAIADEMGCNEIETKDIDCGLWDMSDIKMSDILKEHYGDMKTVILHNGVKISNKYSNRWEKSVELGYRLANPQICVFGRNSKGRETLGKIELSDYEWDGDELAHTGNYRFSEGLFWQPEGYEMQQRLMKMWSERGGE